MDVDLTHGVIVSALVVVASVSAPVEGWRGAVASAAFAVILAAAVVRILAWCRELRQWRRRRESRQWLWPRE